MISVILAGGGKGRRLGGSPKAFLKLDRRPILYYSLEKFYKRAEEIIIVLPPEYVDEWQVRVRARYKKVKVVPGGTHRQDSVMAGLNAIKNRGGIVLIHDIARPFVSDNLIERLIYGAKRYGAAVPYIEPQDTIKKKTGNFVETTLNRDNVICIQTPQAFKTDIIRKAYREAYRENFYSTDDSALVERLGVKVYLVEGERENIKITYPLDIEVAKGIIKRWKKVV